MISARWKIVAITLNERGQVEVDMVPSDHVNRRTMLRFRLRGSSEDLHVGQEFTIDMTFRRG